MITDEKKKILVPSANYQLSEVKNKPKIKVDSFLDYQKESRKTAMYPDAGKNFIYPTLGLAGESGEVAEKIKKVLRDKNGIIDDATRQEIAKELGDVLWYAAQLSTEIGLSLEDIAAENIKKLFSRKNRGMLSGNGDNR